MTRGVAYATSCPGVDIKSVCEVHLYTCLVRCRHARLTTMSGQCGVDTTIFFRKKSEVLSTDGVFERGWAGKTQDSKETCMTSVTQHSVDWET